MSDTAKRTETVLHLCSDIYCLIPSSHCFYSCRVVAESDFLHSLLSKITASKGDSGGQGEVQFFFLNQETSDFSGTSFYTV